MRTHHRRQPVAQLPLHCYAYCSCVRATTSNVYTHNTFLIRT